MKPDACSYKYATPEMQKQAQYNLKRVLKQIYYYQDRIGVEWACRGCGRLIPKTERKTRCEDCKENSRLQEQRNKFKKICDNLTDRYIRRILRQEDPGLKGVEIPQPMIEVRRRQLQLIRQNKLDSPKR
jgi:hypothetical protein